MREESDHIEIDKRTPSWAAIQDKDKLGEELDRLCRVKWHYGALRDVQAKVLRMHKDRCTLDIIINTERESRNLIGKVHSVNRSDIYEAMEEVAKAGFGQDARFAIAQPLAYLPSLYFLLEEKIQGTPEEEHLLEDEPVQQREAAERCGSWLARFHASIPHLGRTLKPSEILWSLQQWTDAIKKTKEPFASRCESLLEKLKTAASSVGGFEPRAGHGSFTPDHVFSNHGRVLAIDLDEHDTADPSRDLATFIVSLKRLGLKRMGTIKAFDEAIDAFLRAYVAHGPIGAIAHLTFYTSAQYLHKAQRDLYKWDLPFRERGEIMLEEGFRALEHQSETTGLS
jgi:aminoglycoside phosphotransferase (APT) family kinase protein